MEHDDLIGLPDRLQEEYQAGYSEGWHAGFDAACAADGARETVQVAERKDRIQCVMFEIFEYAKISDGIDKAEGERRMHQRNAMLAQDRKLRKMLADSAYASNGHYHIKTLCDALSYITHKGVGDPDLAARVRWAIDIEKQRYFDTTGEEL